jgi:hypothetical protein
MQKHNYKKIGYRFEKNDNPSFSFVNIFDRGKE